MGFIQETFSDYGFTIKKKLGSGCWGTAYLAVDSQGQKCCIKSEYSRRRAQAESEAIKNVYGYPSIVLSLHGIHYFTMPYFKGINLKQAMDHGLSLIEKINIAMKIREQLIALHRKGYLHRDIKPDNMIYDATNPTSPIEIIDLGRAVPLKEKDKTLHFSGFRLFFQPQTAPEYVYGNEDDIGEHSDIYSFGLIFCQFFPEETDKISALCHRYDFNLRQLTFDALNDQLIEVFKKKKEELIAQCSTIIDTTKESNTMSLENLRTALRNAELNNKDSIHTLQVACSNAFSDFNSTAVHHLLLKVYEFIAYFGFIKEEEVFKLKMRTFVNPNLNEDTVSLQEDSLSPVASDTSYIRFA
ncbi:protein kinase domain-containing protein [Legionella oakridgensis]|nr:protein kinase [Legionella oakridgensis]ETO92808.1 kinase domain protein [Legionella oakridgensis RV-2-2007]KTD37086.1 Serine/threonine-protein kinase StkP [Legionella oakridgensis]STY20605.1 Serine/threonine-protein kinase PrkC [Legionella longbeachae]